MYVVVANIKCNPQMRQSYVEGDIRHLGPMGGVLFGSEIEISRYTRAWSALLAALIGALTFNSRSECPISIRKKFWKAVKNGAVIHQTHKGKKFVSPHRVISELRTNSRRKGRIKVCFLATHYVSGGWHKGFIHYRQWRKDMWAIHFTKHRNVIIEALRDGYNVVTGGDFNRIDVPKLHPRAVLIVQHGLDHLYAIPAEGYRVVRRDSHVVSTKELHTDHPALVGNFYFEKI